MTDTLFALSGTENVRTVDVVTLDGKHVRTVRCPDEIPPAVPVWRLTTTVDGCTVGMADGAVFVEVGDLIDGTRCTPLSARDARMIGSALIALADRSTAP